MKRLFSFIGMLLISAYAFSQEYRITFSASGDTNVIGTIQVVNLMSLDTVYVQGTDTLLLTNFPVNVENIEMSNDVSIYPNPMTTTSTFEFGANTNGSAIIFVYDLIGKTILSREFTLSSGKNQFRISGFPHGTYIIKVLGKNIKCSSKFVSLSYDNSPNISFISNTPSETKTKSALVTNIVQMEYHDGDRLQYRGQTSSYKNLAVDIPTSSKNQPFHLLTCVDNTGKSYETVEIQVPSKKKSTLDTTYTQTWMAENLNVGVFRTSAEGFHNDEIVEKFCYDNDTNNCNIYGGLYSWDEMMKYQTNDSTQGICPDGWRLPSYYDWINLANYYGGHPFGNINWIFSGDSVAGGMMKEVGNAHWIGPNVGATNETGFTSIGTGIYANGTNGPGFYSIGTNGSYWSSTQMFFDPTIAKQWGMETYTEILWSYSAVKTEAAAVRCIHD